MSGMSSIYKINEENVSKITQPYHNMFRVSIEANSTRSLNSLFNSITKLAFIRLSLSLPEGCPKRDRGSTMIYVDTKLEASRCGRSLFFFVTLPENNLSRKGCDLDDPTMKDRDREVHA